MEILGYRQLISHPFHGIYSPSSPRERAKASRQRIAMKTTAFDRVKDQVGCCGIWCGSCIVGNGIHGRVFKRSTPLGYSYRIDSAGLAVAARYVWKPMTATAMKKAARAEPKNIETVRSIR